MAIGVDGSYNSDGKKIIPKSPIVGGAYQAADVLEHYAALIVRGADSLSRREKILFADALRAFEIALHFIDTAELKNEINPDNFTEKRF